MATGKNVTMVTTKTPSNTSQQFQKPLLKSTAKLKMPSPSLRSALASASSVTTLASQANGTGGRSREGEGRRRGDERWNRDIGDWKEGRMEMERSGETILDKVTVEDVRETTTWDEEELQGSRRQEEEEEGGRKWEEEEGGRWEEEGGRWEEEGRGKLPTLLGL